MNTTNREKLVDRVQKLLALASNNPNQHERELAFERAQAMILENGLTQAELNQTTDDDLTQEHYIRGKYNPGYKENVLARVVGEACQVFAYFVKHGMTKTGSMCFVGRQSNIIVAGHMYEYLDKEFHRQWEKHYNKYFYSKGIKPDKEARLSFYRGVGAGLLNRIREQRQTYADTHALVVVEERQRIKQILADEIAKMDPAKQHEFELRHQCFQGGKAASDNINLNQQVEQTTKNTSQRMLAN